MCLYLDDVLVKTPDQVISVVHMSAELVIDRDVHEVCGYRIIQVTDPARRKDSLLGRFEPAVCISRG